MVSAQILRLAELERQRGRTQQRQRSRRILRHARVSPWLVGVLILAVVLTLASTSSDLVMGLLSPRVDAVNEKASP